MTRSSANYYGEEDDALEESMQPWKEGTTSQRNTGEACWSCAGLNTHAPGPNCLYPDSHHEKRATMSKKKYDKMIHAAAFLASACTTKQEALEADYVRGQADMIVLLCGLDVEDSLSVIEEIAERSRTL